MVLRLIIASQATLIPNYFFSSQSPKEALLETDNISVHATRRTSDPVGDSGRLNSGGSGLFSPLHGNNPYAQGVLNQKPTLPNSPSKVAAAASAAASKGAIFVGSPTKNQNILFYPDTAVQTIAAPAAAFLIRSPVKSAESAWQRARNDFKVRNRFAIAIIILKSNKEIPLRDSRHFIKPNSCHNMGKCCLIR